jgi:hypothetical protein
MKETKIVTFEQHDIEKILTAVCKKKFPGLKVSHIRFEDQNEVEVGFEQFDPDHKEEGVDAD